MRTFARSALMEGRTRGPDRRSQQRQENLDVLFAWQPKQVEVDLAATLVAGMKPLIEPRPFRVIEGGEP